MQHQAGSGVPRRQVGRLRPKFGTKADPSDGPTGTMRRTPRVIVTVRRVRGARMNPGCGPQQTTAVAQAGGH
jgi:hypothetical protein